MAEAATHSEKIAKTHVAYITETWRQSLAKDLSTVASFVFCASIGWYMGSPALEWVGVAIAGIFTFGRALAAFKGAQDARMTPEKAREWLDERFPQ